MICGDGTRAAEFEHVAAYLNGRDLSNFDAKAPPPKTPAFWEIVAATRNPDDAELSDALDDMGRPNAITLGDVANHAPPRSPSGCVIAEMPASFRTA